jgi:hypothetical protein
VAFGGPSLPSLSSDLQTDFVLLPMAFLFYCQHVSVAVVFGGAIAILSFGGALAVK